MNHCWMCGQLCVINLSHIIHANLIKKTLSLRVIYIVYWFYSSSKKTVDHQLIWSVYPYGITFSIDKKTHTVAKAWIKISNVTYTTKHKIIIRRRAYSTEKKLCIYYIHKRWENNNKKKNMETRLRCFLFLINLHIKIWFFRMILRVVSGVRVVFRVISLLLRIHIKWINAVDKNILPIRPKIEKRFRTFSTSMVSVLILISPSPSHWAPLPI